MDRVSHVGQPFLTVRLILATAISTIGFVGFAPVSKAQTQQSPPIRVTVNRVNVGVTVTDSAGHFVEGLRREDFRVFDNDVEQPITDFLSFEEPAQLLVLLESGPAVLFLGKSHLLAADALLSSLAPSDRVAIAIYSREPQLLLNFTRNKSEGRIAMQSISFSNGFAELNLSSALATAIDWVAPLPGKKAIVLLSTGFDSSPPENAQAAREKLLASDVRVLAISLAGDFRKPATRKKKLTARDRSNRAAVREGFAEADQALQELSKPTGGRVYFPGNAEEFSRAYAEIGQLLRHEYSIAFAPPAADGQLHSLRVEVRTASYQVDHRQAYLAPSPN